MTRSHVVDVPPKRQRINIDGVRALLPADDVLTDERRNSMCAMRRRTPAESGEDGLAVRGEFARTGAVVSRAGKHVVFGMGAPPGQGEA